ncbi:MAG: DNA-methyltransferase [Candidatus Hodarchaeota archaeon]
MMIIRSQKESNNENDLDRGDIGKDGIHHGKPVNTRRKKVQAVLDTIIQEDCRQMDVLPDCSVDLMITSPPYNTTKVYDADLTLNEYMQFIGEVLEEVFRVLKLGGIIAFNIANVGRKPYLPLDCYVIQLLGEIGFWVMDEVCWNKGASAGGSCAWGSWKSASNPSLRDIHEYIIIAMKPSVDNSTFRISEKINEFVDSLERRPISFEIGELFSNHWSFNTESAKRVNHPAPFPVELPYRVMLLLSEEGDLVLDPFMGSGTVAIAALASRRHYIGYEIDAEYVEIARKRIVDFIEERGN